MIQSLNNELAYQVSSIDNKKYLVRNDDRKLESANYMAEIHKRLYILTEHLKTNFPNDERIKILKKNIIPIIFPSQ